MLIADIHFPPLLHIAFFRYCRAGAIAPFSADFTPSSYSARPPTFTMSAGFRHADADAARAAADLYGLMPSSIIADCRFRLITLSLIAISFDAIAAASAADYCPPVAMPPCRYVSAASADICAATRRDSFVDAIAERRCQAFRFYCAPLMSPPIFADVSARFALFTRAMFYAILVCRAAPFLPPADAASADDDYFHAASMPLRRDHYFIFAISSDTPLFSPTGQLMPSFRQMICH
jgi:hypothetical protein